MQHVKDCYETSKAVDKVVHEKLNSLVRLYLIVGGMPEAVQKYIETNNVLTVREAQQEIMHLYGKDIAKYDPNNKLYIKDIFDLIPSELNAKNKRFILKALNEKAKFERYRNSFLWLADAGVALPTYNVEEPKLPLKLGEHRNLFKLFLNDVGLLASQYAANIAIDLLTGQTEINFGAIYENFAAQELRAHGYDLYYYNNKRQGELDFIVEDRGQVLPIEIKSGKDYKRHNALSNVLSNEGFNIRKAIVFSNANVESTEKVDYLPIYMLMYLQPATITAPIFKFSPHIRLEQLLYKQNSIPSNKLLKFNQLVAEFVYLPKRVPYAHVDISKPHKSLHHYEKVSCRASGHLRAHVPRLRRCR